MQSNIFHICFRDAWHAQQNAPSYIHPSLQEEGFIHCSTEQQIAGVLERYFDGNSDLLKLEIDPTLLQHKLMYEKATNGEMFPHIYGAINKNAIIGICSIVTE